MRVRMRSLRRRPAFVGSNTPSLFFLTIVHGKKSKPPGAFVSTPSTFPPWKKPTAENILCAGTPPKFCTHRSDSQGIFEAPIIRYPAVIIKEWIIWEVIGNKRFYLSLKRAASMLKSVWISATISSIISSYHDLCSRKPPYTPPQHSPGDNIQRIMDAEIDSRQ